MRVSSGKSDLVEVCVDLKHTTERAILVSDGTSEAWLPLAKIEYERNRDGTITVTLPDWLANSKGLI